MLPIYGFAVSPTAGEESAESALLSSPSVICTSGGNWYGPKNEKMIQAARSAISKTMNIGA